MSNIALTPSQTRELILEKAERVFRSFGYGKATVADIAKACEMSPANVYRFFSSKQQIRQSLTEVLLQRLEHGAARITNEPVSAGERLRKLILFNHQFVLEQFINEATMHELVKIAMDEQWSVVQAHIDRMKQLFRRVIEAGVASGEFLADRLEDRTTCVCNAVTPFCHPQVVAEFFVGDDARQAALMADFLVAALTR